MKVLLLDDAALVRERLASMVGTVQGVEVTSGDPRAAGIQAQIQRQHPDVVVVDVHAPQARGLDLIRWLRAAGDRPVVIALSSSSSFLYRAKCHEAGATYYFDKVREQDQLVEAIVALHQELV